VPSFSYFRLRLYAGGQAGEQKMSSKIYGGIVFPDANLSQAYSVLEGFAPMISVLTSDELATFLAKVACRKLDAVCAGGPNDGRSPLAAAWDEIDKGRRDERQGLRHPLTDFEFRVDLFPFQSNVYGIVRTERDHWRQTLLRTFAPAVAEYAYWDNTDPPDTVPVAEWKERSKVWDQIWRTMMRGRSAGGCRVDLSSTIDPPEPAVIMAKLPNLAARIERTAKDRGIEHFFRSEGDPDEEFDKRDAAIRKIMRAPDWFRSEAGQSWVAAESDRLRDVLIADIDFDLLRQPVRESISGPRP
jgi:hypothetical protein